ncbi:hypothetical protein SARC_11617 [Sphaeroforma arctica JP610]|uniref:Uncharacterized protein n=1 Tax=Sphaeroforma arctica JP610 TaxID=667725 RepID=A0A0L0FHB3_9EUKA|nr:hypothetical protein SARC_11617 [Sphaeroforma arctica JP610]KNC75866.1 hypothetical protein SARC_11617 [Sphaeroforma arctica JP610]|eukprot:XP_014149768.1 hypothetical protein SARC_11617 [Sphaeroforma arctica JP610]
MPMLGKKLIADTLLVGDDDAWYPGKKALEGFSKLNETLSSKLKLNLGGSLKDPILGLEKGSLKKYTKVRDYNVGYVRLGSFSLSVK